MKNNQIDMIVEVLESPLGKDYKSQENLTLLKKLKEKVATEILTKLKKMR